MRKGNAKTIFYLSAVLVACIITTLLLVFARRGDEDAPKEKTYYLTRYDSPDDLILASVENKTGSAVLAISGDTCYVQGDLSLDPDAEEIKDFFDTAYRLPMKSMIEGADASDPQFGLSDPQAEILLQDAKDGGVLFRIGGETPDGEGYYACLSGDARVFVMKSSDAQVFIGATDRFYDLRLLKTADGVFGENPKRITVTREGKTVYSIEASGENEDSAHFFMKEPYAGPIDPVHVRDLLLTPLASLRGIEVIRNTKEESALGFTGEENSFSVTYESGSSVRILVGTEEGVKTYVKREDSGLVMTVPTANLSFYFGSATDVTGDALIVAPLGNLKRLTIGSLVYEIRGTAPDLTVTCDGADMPLQAFQSSVYTALSRISVLGEWDGAEEMGKEPVLTVKVLCAYGEKPAPEVTYAFYELTGNRYGVSVDGQPAFLCSRSAADAMIID